MLGVIKTAIITIIISFISGVLLDTYKNYAPRLLCNMKKLRNSKGKNSDLKTYVFTVKNTSKKIIHDLNINIHNSLKVYDTKISNGLEFHISSENNNFNVSIPFLSKGDEISLKIKVKDIYGGKTKPIITLRSPEDFKKIYARNSKELLSIANDKVNDIRMKGGTFYRNRKLILIIGVILILIYVGVVGGEYTNKKLEEKNTSNNETIPEHDTTSKNITSADNNKINDKPEQKSTSSKSKSEFTEKNNTSNNLNNISNANLENKNEEDKSNAEKNFNEETNNEKENSKVNEDENGNISKEDNTNKKEISNENKKENNKEIIPNENHDVPIKDDNKN
ncbi:hypothetical protein [uncultured Clostridium sp.]|uniref:hypothetical protein n=1 Tax=uncultured Clostridium sp. TaxID=59620 RepID=UPI0025FC600B|nr:hypothetical protein [uncultured Clostridium sp.]